MQGINPTSQSPTEAPASEPEQSDASVQTSSGACDNNSLIHRIEWVRFQTDPLLQLEVEFDPSPFVDHLRSIIFNMQENGWKVLDPKHSPIREACFRLEDYQGLLELLPESGSGTVLDFVATVPAWGVRVIKAAFLLNAVVDNLHPEPETVPIAFIEENTEENEDSEPNPETTASGANNTVQGDLPEWLLTIAFDQLSDYGKYCALAMLEQRNKLQALPLPAKQLPKLA